MWLDLAGWQTVLIAGLTVSSCLLAVRYSGALESFELKAFDRLVRLKPDVGSDSRLLVVGITDSDLARHSFPLPDQVMADLLQTLQQQQPKVIGLDVFRALPQGTGRQALNAQLRSPNVITIQLLGNSEEPNGIPAPSGVPADRVGFNDVVIDPDGVLRRNFIYGQAETEAGKLVDLYSFSTQIARHYLRDQGIADPNQWKDYGRFTWGKAVFTPLSADSGGYRYNDAGGYQVLMNYRSRKIAAPTVTLSQVLEGKVNPALIRNKIVLIGTTAQSAKDLFFTPYSAAERQSPKMPGVQIHAQMVSQLLDAVQGDRALPWFWPEWVEILWITGWAFAGGALTWYVRHPLALSGGGLLLLGTLFVSCFGIVTQQGWVPFVAPALGAIVTGGAVVNYRALQAQKQQQMVMTLLGQNTSPEIALALWNGRDRLLKSGKLPGQALTATIVFTDIRSFSRISEEIDPEILLTWLNEYLAAMAQEVQAHQGIINKFTGDGLMAVFGVPVARTEWAEISQDAKQAVACALAMGDRLAALNQEWQQHNLPVVQMRAGIFTGPVVVGSLGGKDRMEYGVIGDSVNIASRLESCEKDRQEDICRVLIAHDTLLHLEGQFAVEAWGPLALRGKQQMVEVYRVLGHLPKQATSAVEKLTPLAQEHLREKTDVEDKTMNPKLGTS